MENKLVESMICEKNFETESSKHIFYYYLKIPLFDGKKLEDKISKLRNVDRKMGSLTCIPFKGYFILYFILYFYYYFYFLGKNKKQKALPLLAYEW